MSAHVHNEQCEPSTPEKVGLCVLTPDESRDLFVNAVRHKGWEPDAFVAAYESGELDWDPQFVHEVMMIPFYSPVPTEDSDGVAPQTSA